MLTNYHATNEHNLLQKWYFEIFSQVYRLLLIQNTFVTGCEEVASTAWEDERNEVSLLIVYNQYFNQMYKIHATDAAENV